MTQREELVRVLRYVKKYWALLLVSMILAAGSVLLSLYIPILAGQAIDCILSQRVNFQRMYPILLRIVIFALGAGAAQWMMSLIHNHITYRVVRDIRKTAFDKIWRVPLSYLDTASSGDLLSRMIADVDTFADGLLMGFTQFFTGVITILGTLFFMLRINVWIALVVILVTPLSLFVAAFIAKRTHHLFVKQSFTRGQMTSLVEEMLENEKVVKAYGQEENVLKRFDQVNDELTECSIRAIFYSSLTNPCTRFVNGVVYAGVALSGALVAISGGITVGALSSFLSYANQYTKPFNEISGVVTELQNALACAGRVFEFLDECEREQLEPMIQIPAFEGESPEVHLSNVSFSYVKTKPLLRNLNLKVKPGQTVAIVGPTGCGKTTLINLLMRFYDVDAGKIEFAGADTRYVSREELRSYIGMVLQETWLKQGTIAENISMGRPEATRNDIIRAARASHADSFIRRLPSQYDTVIREDGGSLSQGQKQLLCIARVMLMLPPVLILDEATSSIDTRTETKIQSAFARLMKGRTCFVVAHRLSTIQNADTILVMKDGDIIEQGSHETLLQRKGFYSELYYSQYE